MKKFVVKLIIFGFCIYVVDLIFGFTFSFLQDRAPFGNWQRFRYINNEMKDEIVIMGSSRAAHHYVPQVFEDSLKMSCYNCGVDGNGILMFWANYQMFTERYTPKLIIYDLSGFDIMRDDHSTYMGWLRAYYDKECVQNVFDDLDPIEKYKMFSNLYRWNFKFIQLFTDNIAAFVASEKGYKPLSGVMNYTPGKDNNAITDNADCFVHDDLKLAYLEKMILSCKEKGIKLIFTVSPMYGVTSSIRFNKIFELAKQNNCSVIDYFASPKYARNNKYFKDSSHMNDDGAREYTSDVCHEIKNIISQ